VQMIKTSGVRSVRAGCWASRRVCPYRGLVCPCQGLLVGSCDAMRGLIETGMGFTSRSFSLHFASCVWTLVLAFGLLVCVACISSPYPPTLFYPPTHTSTNPFLSFPCVWEGFEVPDGEEGGEGRGAGGDEGETF
jgi:hypothetical protein